MATGSETVAASLARTTLVLGSAQVISLKLVSQRTPSLTPEPTPMIWSKVPKGPLGLFGGAILLRSLLDSSSAGPAIPVRYDTHTPPFVAATVPAPMETC